MFPSRQIERGRNGGVRLSFDEHELLLLRDLLDELEVLLGEPDDPALRRLFPPAYKDPESDEQYRSLVRDQLVAGRSQALAAVRKTLRRDKLSAEEADVWLRALNDLRLVLGTRLDVTEDIDYEELDLAVYAYLSWLQEQLVEALGEG